VIVSNKTTDWLKATYQDFRYSCVFFWA